ncbi:hypothetical protein GCM10028858_10880 [Halorubrum pallidum]
MLFEHRLLLGLGAFLGLSLSVGVAATLLLALAKLFHLFLSKLLETFVVGVLAHTRPFTVRAKNDFGGIAVSADANPDRNGGGGSVRAA